METSNLGPKPQPDGGRAAFSAIYESALKDMGAQLRPAVQTEGADPVESTEGGIGKTDGQEEAGKTVSDGEASVEPNSGPRPVKSGIPTPSAEPNGTQKSELSRQTVNFTTEPTGAANASDFRGTSVPADGRGTQSEGLDTPPFVRMPPDAADGQVGHQESNPLEFSSNADPNRSEDTTPRQRLERRENPVMHSSGTATDAHRDFVSPMPNSNVSEGVDDSARAGMAASEPSVRPVNLTDKHPPQPLQFMADEIAAPFKSPPTAPQPVAQDGQGLPQSQVPNAARASSDATGSFAGNGTAVLAPQDPRIALLAGPPDQQAKPRAEFPQGHVTSGGSQSTHVPENVTTSRARAGHGNARLTEPQFEKRSVATGSANPVAKTSPGSQLPVLQKSVDTSEPVSNRQLERNGNPLVRPDPSTKPTDTGFAGANRMPGDRPSAPQAVRQTIGADTLVDQINIPRPKAERTPETSTEFFVTVKSRGEHQAPLMSSTLRTEVRGPVGFTPLRDAVAPIPPTAQSVSAQVEPTSNGLQNNKAVHESPHGDAALAGNPVNRPPKRAVQSFPTRIVMTPMTEQTWQGQPLESRYAQSSGSQLSNTAPANLGNLPMPTADMTITPPQTPMPEIGSRAFLLDGAELLSEVQTPRGEQAAGGVHAMVADGTQVRADAARLPVPQLVEILTRQPDRPMEIQMSPEELGRVRMALSTSESGVTLVITAERPETLDLMRRHIDQLAQDFRRMGYENIGFEFRNGGSGAQGGHTGSGKSVDLQSDLDGNATPQETESTATQPRSATSGLDLRV